jgi:hypothetical protein
MMPDGIPHMNPIAAKAIVHLREEGIFSIILCAKLLAVRNINTSSATKAGAPRKIKSEMAFSGVCIFDNRTIINI